MKVTGLIRRSYQYSYHLFCPEEKATKIISKQEEVAPLFFKGFKKRLKEIEKERKWLEELARKNGQKRKEHQKMMKEIKEIYKKSLKKK